MTYDNYILQILADVGERGIGVRLLAKHVYNMSCTLFSQPDLQEIHSYVQSYLLKNSKLPQSLIERTERRGWYRLNTRNNAYARQLRQTFQRPRNVDDDGAEEPQRPSKDLSLSLFD